MDLKKARYILPNSFTLASVFFGFYSILLTVRAEDGSQLGMAAWMIAISMVMDGLDGRVARATNSQSEFGLQLDSLADAIAFGVAPAFLIYTWGLEPLGFLGIFLAFVYAACGILRLARFNVTSSSEEGPSNHFQGLPIPLAAGGVISLVLAHTSLSGKMVTSANGAAAIITILLSLLMVSNVPYRSFKKIKSKRMAVAVAAMVLLGLVVTSLQFGPGLGFTGLMAGYILLGIVESIIGFGRKRFGRRAVVAVRESGRFSRIETDEGADRFGDEDPQER